MTAPRKLPSVPSASSLPFPTGHWGKPPLLELSGSVFLGVRSTCSNSVVSKQHAAERPDSLAADQGGGIGKRKRKKKGGGRGGTAEDTERLGALVPGLRLQAWTSPLDWAARRKSVAATGDSRTGYSGSFYEDLALLERGSEQPLAFLLSIPPPQAEALFFSVFGCAQRNIPTPPP